MMKMPLPKLKVELKNAKSYIAISLKTSSINEIKELALEEN
jgi:hypothetical protein